jgi:hypothetical protein
VKRGAVKKTESRLVPVRFPVAMLPQLDAAIHILDTDRSKFIRTAVREKMARAGFRLFDAKCSPCPQRAAGEKGRKGWAETSL